MGQFIDIYKKVDNILKSTRGTDTGVTAYIDEMDNLRDSKWYGIEWRNVYRTLKHCRYVRNKIVHEVDASEENLLEGNEINELNAFRESVILHTDPLAERAEREFNANNRPTIVNLSCDTYNKPATESKQHENVLSKLLRLFKKKDR